MKKQFFGLIIGTALLASCSSPENKVTEYSANVKGFYNGQDDENGLPIFDILTLQSVIDDWDGNDDFSPNSGSEKLIKVELTGETTSSEADLGLLESNIALFDVSTKTTYTATVSLSTGATFKGLATRHESGYAVYSVPSEVSLENLYIGTDKLSSKSDLSGEKTENLLALKKLDAPKEETKEINTVKVVEDNVFGITKTYTFKSIVYNANDETVKKFRSENPESANYSIVRLDIDIESSSDSKEAWISIPWLISEYELNRPDYSFGETPSTIAPGKHSFSFYYKVYTGSKIFGFNGEDQLGKDYSIKL